MPARVAACSCGRLTATVTGEPIRISVCHCLACQRRTGSVFGQQARFRSQDVTIAGNGTDYTRAGDSGGRVTFTFCPVCGSTVCYRIEGAPEAIAIPVGAFADSSFPSPSFSVYEERRHAWVSMPEGIERHH